MTDNQARDEVSEHRVISLLQQLHQLERDPVTELQQLDQDQLFSLLRDLLQHPDTDISLRAVEVLLKLNAQKTQSWVLPLLKDASSTVRYGTAYQLVNYGDEHAVDALIETVLTDPDADVRSLAITALAWIGDPRAIPALEQVVHHDRGTDFQDSRLSLQTEQAIRYILRPPHN
jgi:HEAT repeat protein